MPSIETRLKDMGIDLPAPPTPLANYVPAVIAGGFQTGFLRRFPGFSELPAAVVGLARIVHEEKGAFGTSGAAAISRRFHPCSRRAGPWHVPQSRSKPPPTRI